MCEKREMSENIANTAVTFRINISFSKYFSKFTYILMTISKKGVFTFSVNFFTFLKHILKDVKKIFGTGF